MAGHGVDAAVRLTTPAGWLPGQPVTVLVELLDEKGRPDRSAWDAEAALTTDQPGITLSPESIPLRNGLGTALVTFAGAAGEVELTASIADETDSRSMVSLAGQLVTQVSGRLDGDTIWRGVVLVTGDVTVPAGSTLSIEPGTVVMLDGVDLGTGGTDLIIEGAIQSLGNEAEPVVFTCVDPEMNWGQIRHDNAAHSEYRHTFVHKAGRAPGEGHTDTGPAIRSRDSSLLLDHCVISDITANGGTIGKIMMAQNSELVIQSCVFARARMGPEIAGTSLLCRNTFILDMTGPDDADGIYLHDSDGKPLMLDRCVIAFGDDDGVDTLNSRATIQNSIVRDFPNTNEDAKGVSVFHGTVIVRRCLVVNCYIGVSAKSSGPLASLSVEHCTIDAATAGVAAATKYNARVGNIAIHVNNSIVLGDEAIRSDFGDDKITVEYSNTSQPWPGAGNLSQPPGFIDAVAGDYRLLAESPCVNAGDPAAPTDTDGSRSDLGFHPLAGEPPEESWLRIVSPTGDIEIQAPGVTPVEVIGHMAGGPITRVEFFVNGERVSEDDSPPYRLDWANRRIGEFTLSASAHNDAGGVITSSEVRVTVIRDRQFTTWILIEEGSVWKYLDDGTDPGVDWIQHGFDDSGWNEGPAELGYGENDEATLVRFGPDPNEKFITTWFRKTFQVGDAAQVKNLSLRLLRDDGAMVHINGREALRVNLPDGEVDFQTRASSSGDYNIETWPLEAGLLKTGANEIAVEVHQSRPDSSDISFELGLIAELDLPENSGPFVTLELPAPGLLVANGAPLALAADAFDLDGRIERVEFLANGQVIETVRAEPFQASWHPLADGDFSLVAVAWDDAGGLASSPPVTVTVSSGTAPPSITSQSPAPGSVTALSQVTVVFTKPVLHVDAADLLLNGQPAEFVSGGGDTWRFTFAEPAHGTVAVSWAAEHGITDRFAPAHPFDGASPASLWAYDYVDIVSPVIYETIPARGVIVSALREMTLEFSEQVTGVDATDLRVNGLPAYSVSGVGRGPYRFQFAQQTSGRIHVAWVADHGIRDTHGNLFAEDQWEIRVESGFVGVIINEIMYHPSSRDDGEEYIELFNRNTESVALHGWRFVRGVGFDFPEIRLPPSGRLVLAANPEKFRAKYPGVELVVGGGRGRVSNSHDTLVLVDAKGREVDRVAYADEGDWALRVRGPLDRGHHGWHWQSGHDGLGRSLELVNPALPNEFGQNWAASEIELGTPGQANSARRPDLPPMIVDVAHFPVVPRSSDLVLVSARLIDESSDGLAASLHYRIASGEEAEAFAVTPMNDDGRAGDALAGDGIFSAVIAPQPADTVVEFFIEATDAIGQARTRPAPALRLDGSLGQETNLLYQVDDAPPGNGPLYRLIMTGNECRELEETGNRSDAQVNGTFVSHDGTRTECHHLVGIRDRGHGSRGRKPDNFRVNFRSDALWKNRTALNLNGQYSWSQHLGATLSLKAGAVGSHAWEVRMRVNNQDPAASGFAERTNGFYAANEVVNSQWAEWHFPGDNSGNLYRARRDIAPSDFGYRGENPDDYRNTWFKASNTAADDWSDLIGMLRVLDPEAELSIDDLRQVINVEQWLTHLAVMSLLNSRESGLNTGFNDDYLMYRGTRDPRFNLLFYDLDTVVNQGDTSSSPNDTLYGADRLPVFDAFLHHPEIEPIYHRILLELIETAFSETEFDAMLEQTLGGTVSEATRNEMKSWMNRRRQFVASQIEQPFAPPPRLGVVGVPRSPTPLTSATLRVTGAAEYRFKLDDDLFGVETAAATPIELSGLANGTHTVSILARTADGAWPPNAAALSVSWEIDAAWPSVRLNEILAMNQAAFMHGGAFHGYIELFNEGVDAADLSGMSLARDPDELDGFQFPAGTVLDAGGTLLLFTADHLPLGFDLDAIGGGVFLFGTAANGRRLLDSVKYGQQIADLSFGRVHGGQWQLNRPTPDAVNKVQPTGDPAALRINEWLALGGPDDPAGFVELFNSLDLPVPLGGLALTDRPNGLPGRGRISPLSFIAARGFRLFVAGGDSSRDARRLGFRLDSGPGEIALFGQDATKLDHVVYGPQIPGRSMGCCPDGVAHKTAFAWPSPGAANFCPSALRVPGDTRLIAFDHSWKYDDSGSDLGTEWRAPDFDDSSWSSGPGLLGLEDESLPEPLRTGFENIGGKMTYYFRTTFEVDPGNIPATARVTHVIDDGAVFYLNGEEFGERFELGANEEVDFLTRANAGGDADMVIFDFNPALLRPGPNSFAVEVHQASPGSSDIVFGLQLDTVNLEVHPATAGVCLNEALANPVGSSWVELFNPADFAVSLDGLGLTDDLSLPHRWTFATGTVIEPLGFLRIDLMSGQPASASNSGFGLSSAGGEIHLTRRADEGGGMLDWLRFGLLPPGGSIGRSPDAGSSWTLTLPTPLAANTPAPIGSPIGVRINEWMAAPADGGDWVELFNPSALPVDLTGLFLSDDLVKWDKDPFPPLTFIGANSFLQLMADDRLAKRADYLGFKLNRPGESIGLSAPSGILLDAVTFGRQTTDVSEGRYPNGATVVISFPGSPTPGEANRPATPADADHDGLPDEWETWFGFDPTNPADAALDTDTDGLDNAAEFAAGLDPNDPESTLSIQVIQVESNQVVLILRAPPNRLLWIQNREALNRGAWQTLSEISTTADPTEVVIPMFDELQHFFRLAIPTGKN